MNTKEIDLTVKMLEDYEERLGRAVCNDTDRGWLDPFTKDEIRQMNHDFNRLNGSPEDAGDSELPDYCYVALMIHRLKWYRE